MLEKAYPSILGGRCPECKSPALNTLEIININGIDTNRCIACGWVEIDFNQISESCKDRAKQFSKTKNPNVSCFNKDNQNPFCSKIYYPLIDILDTE